MMQSGVHDCSIPGITTEEQGKEEKGKKAIIQVLSKGRLPDTATGHFLYY